jgi:hypothetical protein
VSAAQSQRAATAESSAQGAVLAPVDGRVLRVPVRSGGVVMMGEDVALVGSAFILKVLAPERHAALLEQGGVVIVEQAGETHAEGRIERVYPALADGRVEADIAVEGLEGRVFGERVRVWLPGEERQALVVPGDYLTTRFGVDFARLKPPAGEAQDVVVRRGEPVAAQGVRNGVEVLAGLSPGDQLVRPLP